MQLVFSQVDVSERNDRVWTILAPTKDSKSSFGKSYINIADFDTFLSMNGKHESQVVQNAIEHGQFRSVNKIRKPDVCTVELAKGGSIQDIQLVLDNLKKYKDGTDLLIIYTPFGALVDMNLVGLDYSFRRGESTNILVAKLTFQEVQSAGLSIEYTTEFVKNPEDTNTATVGKKEKKEVQ